MISLSLSYASAGNGTRLAGAELRRVARSRKVACACAIAAALIGAMVLGGWAFGVSVLKSPARTAVSMKPNTALGTLLGALGCLLAILGPRKHPMTKAGTTLVAVLVAAIGITTLAEYALGVDLGVDQILFHDAAHAAKTVTPGRMGVATAVCLAVAGWALVLTVSGRALAQQLTASAVVGFAVTVLLGKLYGMELERPPATTEIGDYTVAAMTALGYALLFARPAEGMIGALQRDEPGALMARLVLPVALLALPMLGGLRLAGEHAGIFSYRLGVVMMVIFAMVLLTVVVGLTARRLNALGRQRSAALERLTDSEDRLRRTLDHLFDAQESERRSLAGDLHDDALPTIAAVALQLELAQAQSSEPEVRERLGSAEAELRSGGARLRTLMFDLRPETLAAEGLGGALRHRLDRMRELTGVDYELRDGLGLAAPHSAAILYRIAAEALHNVAQHARATRVRVELARGDERIELSVADDGVGMPWAGPRPGHIGLVTMAERADLAGGGMAVESAPGQGTRVRVWVPSQPPPGEREF